MKFENTRPLIPQISSFSPSQQLVGLLVLSIVGLSLASFLSLVVLTLGFGYSLNDLNSFTSNPTLPGALNVLRISQFLTSFGVFILPAVIFLKYARPKIYIFPPSINVRSIFWLIFSAFLMITQLPLINALADWNKALFFPESLRLIETWMQAQELQAENLTEVFLTMNSLSDLIISMVIMAIIPAIGEELLFRGALQTIITRISKKPHIAIWITAFVFSFIHFQFYGFLPRFLLGAFLGYLFYWSGSIWFPIAAHFANNALAVLVTYADQHGLLGFSADNLGLGSNAFLETSFSIVCLFLGLVIFRKSLYNQQLELVPIH